MMTKSQRDDRANRMNPNNAAYKANLDNRSVQLGSKSQKRTSDREC